MTDDADVLATARTAVETGPLCDPCLGRLVADRSFGLTNRERERDAQPPAALAVGQPETPVGHEPPETRVTERARLDGGPGRR